jgi:predicted TIM-barrel fold metal-dependent hydrolase
VREVQEYHSTNSGDFRISIVPVINPVLPHWREHFVNLLHEHGSLIAGVRIVPNYHDYHLGLSGVGELAKICVANDIPLCIQVRMQDERSHHPLLKVPGVKIASVVMLAAEQPDLRIVVCGAYNAELPQMSLAPNVFVELSFVESGETLPNALKHIDPSRLLFATHYPVHDPAPAVAKLGGDVSLEPTIRTIASDNAGVAFTL